MFFEDVLKIQVNTTKFLNLVLTELCFALSNFASDSKHQIFLFVNISQIPKLLLKISQTHKVNEVC